MGRKRVFTERRVGMYIREGTRTRINNLQESMLNQLRVSITQDELINFLLDTLNNNNIAQQYHSPQGGVAQVVATPLRFCRFPDVLSDDGG